VVAAAAGPTLGLKPGVPARHEQRPSVRELFVSGFSEARNPRVLLAYSAAFIARGDQAVNAFFLILWGTLAGKAAGMERRRGGQGRHLMFVSRRSRRCSGRPSSALPRPASTGSRRWPSAWCWRPSATCRCCCWTTRSPTTASSSSSCSASARSACSLSAQSLIGQEAPADKRGSVLGAFNVSGAIGILLITWSAARCSMPSTRAHPSSWSAVINVLLFFASLYVRLKAGTAARDRLTSRRQPASPATAAAQRRGGSAHPIKAI
jgi:hypothetical protein